ncbi:MAG: diguanylate cyclase/phosphodiesterase with sensor(s), partial [Actinomycetia bacterium]|nr:diguanylate cyclase/phosphodiesterase with sensor(s) [Actinomycetes bacterium]
ARRGRAVLDASLVVAALLFVAWAWVLGPIYRSSDDHVLVRVLSLAYPVADLLVVALLLWIGGRVRGSERVVIALVGAGLSAIAISDASFAWLDQQGTFGLGSVLDTGWFAGFLLVALGALWTATPSAPDDGDNVASLTSIVLPYLPLVLTLTSVLGFRLDHRPLGPFLSITAGVMLVVLVARQLLAQAENLSLSRRLAAEVVHVEGRFAALVRRSADLTTILSAQGVIQYQSPATAQLLGRDPDALVGTPFTALLHPEDVAGWRRLLRQLNDHPDAEAVVEWRLLDARGGHVDVESLVTNLVGDPSVAGIVLNSRDVTDRKRLEGELRHQAFHDPLTGLANRALLRDRLEHALARGERHAGSLGVLFVDLDDFKAVNDGRGHAAGDELLLAVGARLRDTVRASDTVARLGGDEFAILVEGPAAATHPASTGERILEAFDLPFRIGGDDVYVHASIGVALAETDGIDAGELLRNADVAMYAAKSAGKNRCEVFHSGLHDRIIRRLQIEADLQRALEDGELVVHYQPIVDLETSRMLSVEALVRWQHPVHGLIPPMDFIPAAETTGLIVPLTIWVLRQACTDVLRLAEVLELPDLALKVNLSTRHLDDDDLPKDVAGVLEHVGFAPGRLTLEITETALMADPERALVGLQRLRDLGVRLAIDDFGTGYSSFSYLGRLPVDELKIDRSFVAAMVVDGDAPSALVRTIVGLAEELGLTTVGEGIETEDQLARLRGAGCQQGQGFLLARPVGVEQLIRVAAAQVR